MDVKRMKSRAALGAAEAALAARAALDSVLRAFGRGPKPATLDELMDREVFRLAELGRPLAPEDEAAWRAGIYNQAIARALEGLGVPALVANGLDFSKLVKRGDEK